ncbi:MULTISPECIES: DUF2798 domain-containing protein [Pseudomonas]|uniref:DUF2798 domain-containing protein n=1 Tax=Pseudomonas flexibilis TaxID=706570 RepID=A0A0B3BNN9_9PSED|nr:MULTISPECIES: DUF2798 domain-containing protein [Pseudomonas]KHL70545.1 hypothetical protein SF06_06290 [Pseudomonas flexibilis]KHO66113.1 hypothetical protein PT85_00550 [Pseudomonas flexibilis]SCY51107.1 Protein of unknown function [Pseudomonas flexibilis]SIQ81588.1 Protein of unknown function [Pseudomonas flexibilis]
MKLPKLPLRLAPYVFAFYMSGLMAAVMTCVITALNRGLGAGYLETVLKVYAMTMPVAFCSVLLVRPIVGKLVEWTVRKS